MVLAGLRPEERSFAPRWNEADGHKSGGVPSFQASGAGVGVAESQVAYGRVLRLGVVVGAGRSGCFSFSLQQHNEWTVVGKLR